MIRVTGTEVESKKSTDMDGGTHHSVKDSAEDSQTIAGGLLHPGPSLPVEKWTMVARKRGNTRLQKEKRDDNNEDKMTTVLLLAESKTYR